MVCARGGGPGGVCTGRGARVVCARGGGPGGVCTRGRPGGVCTVGRVESIDNEWAGYTY